MTQLNIVEQFSHFRISHFRTWRQIKLQSHFVIKFKNHLFKLYYKNNHLNQNPDIFHFMGRKKQKKLNIKKHKRFKITINFQISMIGAFYSFQQHSESMVWGIWTKSWKRKLSTLIRKHEHDVSWKTLGDE